MSDSTGKKHLRLSGSALRLVARLAETPGAGAVFFSIARRQLGLAQIEQTAIPSDTAPYLPLHLGGHRRDEGSHG